MNRTVKTVAASLAGIAIVVGSLYPAFADDQRAMDHAKTMLDIRLKSEPWLLPNLLSPVTAPSALDTDAPTRGLANQRLTDRLGISANQAARADRVHVAFDHGSHRIAPGEAVKLRSLASAADRDDRIVVTGYAGQEVDAEQGLAIAQRRASAVATLIKEANPGLRIHLDASGHWPGTSDTARRAEVYRLTNLATR
jgi:outer membrane protein OmpA-like peptidoglycan-associated protein